MRTFALDLLFVASLAALLFYLAELRAPLGGLGGLWPVLLAGVEP